MNQASVLNVQLTADAWQAILNLIGEQPTKNGWFPLMEEIKRQAEAQLQPRTTEEMSALVESEKRKPRAKKVVQQPETE